MTGEAYCQSDMMGKTLCHEMMFMFCEAFSIPLHR